MECNLLYPTDVDEPRLGNRKLFLAVAMLILKVSVY